MTRKLKNMEGTLFSNRYGEVAEVIEYRSSKDVLVRFIDNGHECVKSITHLRAGKFTSPYTRTVFNTGYSGVGQYNGIQHRKVFKRWSAMLGRCYDPTLREINKTYNDCTVCDEWHNFQNYAEWYFSNEYRNDDWEVDKDLRVAGCRIYSPSTCTFVPPEINSFLLLHKQSRGPYPIGVYYSKSNGAFVARCKTGEKEADWLGQYRTPDAAFLAYKSAKEAHAKVLANTFNGKVHPEVVTRLREFTVNIDD